MYISYHRNTPRNTNATFHHTHSKKSIISFLYLPKKIGKACNRLCRHVKFGSITRSKRIMMGIRHASDENFSQHLSHNIFGPKHFCTVISSLTMLSFHTKTIRKTVLWLTLTITSPLTSVHYLIMFTTLQYCLDYYLWQIY